MNIIFDNNLLIQNRWYTPIPITPPKVLPITSATSIATIAKPNCQTNKKDTKKMFHWALIIYYKEVDIKVLIYIYFIDLATTIANHSPSKGNKSNSFFSPIDSPIVIISLLLKFAWL